MATSILIVEDERVVSKQLARTLESLDYEIAGIVSTGEEAIQEAEASRPNLVLMDIVLEGEMDGIEAADQIRSRLDTPVVYLTAHTEKDMLERAKKTEPYAYLSKPVDIPELRNTIETALYKHKADKRIRESEERFQKTFRHAPVLMAVSQVDDGMFIDVNDRFCAVSGFSREEAIGRTSIELGWLRLEDRSRLIEELQARGRVSDMELVLHSKHNEEIHCIYCGELVMVGDRQYLLSLAHDITERKKAEDALQKKTDELGERVKELNCLFGLSELSQQPDISLEAIVHGLVAFIPSAWQYPEITCARIVVQDRECKTDNFAESVWKQTAEIVARGEPRGLVEVRYIEQRPERDEGPFLNEERALINIIAKHLGRTTERFMTEEELWKSEEEYRSLFEDSPVGIFRITPDGKFLKANTSMARMCGYESAEELIQQVRNAGEDLWVNPGDRQEAIQALTIQSPVEREVELKRQTGDRFYADARVRIVKDDAGKTLYFEGIVQDITSRKEAEEARRRAEQELRIRNKILEIFASIPDEQAYAEVLKFVRETLESRYGTFGFFDDVDNFVVPAMTREIYWEQCQIPDKEMIFQRGSFRGIWADCLEQRRTLYSNEGPFRIPPGHVPIRNTMVTPIMYRGQIIATIHIANKPSGYDERDKELLEMVATYMAPVLNARLERDRKDRERKAAEEALAKSRASFSSIVEKTADGMLVLDTEGKVLYSNPSAAALLGRSQEDVGEIWFGRGVVHKELTEMDILRVDGEVGVAEMRLEETNWEGNPAYLAMVRDITERRRAEDALKRLAIAVEQSAETIIITDREGVIRYVNPAFQQSSGYSPQEVIGKKTRFLHGDRDDEPLYDQPLHTIHSGKTWRGNFVSKRKDGTLYHESATISPVRDASGEIINYVAVKRDITQQIQLEEQLRRAQKMEAVGTLAGGIAHDFNNLLQVIVGYGELLSDEMEKTDPRYPDLEIMLKAGQRGADLVRSILTFSKEADAEVCPTDLNAEIRHACKLILRTIPKMIDIELHLADDLKRVNADPSQMEQVLLNLAVNARDAMPEGGRLVIETENIYLDEGYCRRHVEVKPGHYVRMVVSDTGCGMEPEVVERIFEPFYTTKKGGEGTGLGLSMVFGIVKNHGGHILCYSEPGVGTSFKIDIPVLEAHAGENVAESKEMQAFGTETILVVDDEEHIRELARRYLVQAGYRVMMAANGEEALKVYRENQSDIALVILDLIMPQMGGKECLRELLQINLEVKVLVASGFSADGPTRDTIRAGAKGFITKPFKTRDMLRTIRQVLDES